MNTIAAHIRSFKQAWLSIFKQPLEHLINILVLALLISLCISGRLVNNNLASWQKKNIAYPQMVVYLNQSASQSEVSLVEKQLNQLSQTTIHDYQFISKKQGLAELQHDQQLKEITDDVIDPADNPLPDILVIHTATADSGELQRLNLQLTQLPMVDQVQLDFAYAGKISELIAFASSMSRFIQSLFIIVLSLVVYNMIRLQMFLKSDEILVSRLIGASDSFIMRPLIHYAVWQVTLAMLLAGLATNSAAKLLNTLLANFSNLFGKGLQLISLPLLEFLIIWLILVVFTIFTVFLAVRWVFYNTQANQRS